LEINIGLRLILDCLMEKRGLDFFGYYPAMGEEPYSVAILVHELLQKEKLKMNLHIFATDIDTKILKGAKNAVYSFFSVENIKYRLLTKYFIPQGKNFRLIPKIRDQVTSSFYDMLDKKHAVPPDIKDYLHKPILINDLSSKVRNVLDTAKKIGAFQTFAKDSI